MRKARSRKGLETMPWVSAPIVARTSKVVASASAGPDARTTWPRGMARLKVTVPAAGSHSQYPTWSWKVSTSPGCTMWVWYRSP